MSKTGLVIGVIAMVGVAAISYNLGAGRDLPQVPQPVSSPSPQVAVASQSQAAVLAKTSPVPARGAAGPYAVIPISISASPRANCCGIIAVPQPGWNYSIITFALENTSGDIASIPSLLKGTIVDSGGNSRNLQTDFLVSRQTGGFLPILPGQKIRVTGAAYMPEVFTAQRLSLSIEHIARSGQTNFPSQAVTVNVALGTTYDVSFAPPDGVKWPVLADSACFDFAGDREWCVGSISLGEQQGMVYADVGLVIKNKGGNNINVSSFSSYTPFLILWDDSGAFAANTRPLVEKGCLSGNMACLVPGREDQSTVRYESMLKGPLSGRRIWAAVVAFGKDRELINMQTGKRILANNHWAVRQIS